MPRIPHKPLVDVVPLTGSPSNVEARPLQPIVA
jgi:hypothetical protein